MPSDNHHAAGSSAVPPPRVLTKTRYDLPNGFCLDELHGKLEGMWILEHEHAEGEEMPVIPKFITVMMEVTDRPVFKTNQLVERVAALQAYNSVVDSRDMLSEFPLR